MSGNAVIICLGVVAVLVFLASFPKKPGGRR